MDASSRSDLVEQTGEHALLDAVPHKAWIADEHGAIVYVNRQAREYLGSDADGFLDDGWLSFTHPEDALLASEAWAMTVRTGEPFEVVGRLRRADGAYRWHVGRTAAMRDTAGRVVRWVVTFSDVDERHRAALALAESEERAAAQLAQLEALQTLLTDGEELTGSGSWFYDVVTDRVRLSPGAQRLLGLDASEVPSRAVLDRFDPADVEQVIVREFAGSDAWQLPVRARTVASPRRTLELRMTQRLGPKGGLVAVAGTVQDVTARVAAQAGAQLWADVAAQAPIGLLVLRLDEDTGHPDLETPVSVNHRAQGYEQPAEYLARLTPEGTSRLFDTAACVVTSGTPVELDEVLLRHDELGERHVRSLLYPLKTPDLIVLAGVDVTEQRQAQAERDALRERSIQAAETERRRIGAHLHNEVLQLLVAAMLRLDDACDGPEHERCRRVGAPLRAAAQALRLTSLELVPAPLVGTRLSDAIKIYAATLLGRQGPDVEVSVDPIADRAAPDLQEASYRIAQEALSNAVRHAQATRITVAIGAEGDRLVGEVRDDGIGCAPDLVRDGCLGLGLMRERAEVRGGGFELVPSPPGGTIARWWLPLGPNDPPD